MTIVDRHVIFVLNFYLIKNGVYHCEYDFVHETYNFQILKYYLKYILQLYNYFISRHLWFIYYLTSSTTTKCVY